MRGEIIALVSMCKNACAIIAGPHFESNLETFRTCATEENHSAFNFF